MLLLVGCVPILLSGCVTSKQSWQRAERVDQIHENAPAWLKASWQNYLTNMQGQFGIFAMDTMARGAGYTYCTSGCNVLIGNQGQAYKSLWAARAIESCQDSVRKGHPVARPDCEIYALRDDIVWRHRFPWRVE